MTWTQSLWNGDDAVGLVLNDVLIDVVGDPNVDPGSGWDVCSDGSTKDKTLVRKSSISTGNVNWSESSAESTCEWDVYPKDTFDYVGAHTCDNCGVAAGCTTDLDCEDDNA